MQVLERKIPVTTSEAFSRAVGKQEPVLLSVRYLQGGEILSINEAD